MSPHPTSTPTSTNAPVPSPASATPTSALSRSTLLFLAFAFAGIWALVLPFLLSGTDIPGVVIFAGRLIPLLASLAAWAITRPGSLSTLWRLHLPGTPLTAGHLGLAALLAAGVVLGVDILHGGLSVLTGISSWAPSPQLLMVLGMLVPVMLMTAVSTFGEEVGWRGHLRSGWEHLGFWRSSRLIALVWVAWHIPLTLVYHLQDTMSVRDNLATWLSLAPLSILLCALVDRMHLVWVAVFAHAVPRLALQQNTLVDFSTLDDTRFWVFWAMLAALTLGAAMLLRRAAARRGTAGLTPPR